MAATVTVTWNYAAIANIAETIPMAAHQQAAVEAAAASAAIAPVGYGTLAAEVRVPKPTGPYSSEVGSSLVYAAIQNWGGTISPGKLMGPLRGSSRVPAGFTSLATTGPRKGGQFTSGGQRPLMEGNNGGLVFARSVTVPGTHYLDAAGPAYSAACVSALAAMEPG